MGDIFCPLVEIGLTVLTNRAPPPTCKGHKIFTHHTKSCTAAKFVPTAMQKKTGLNMLVKRPQYIYIKTTFGKAAK